MSTPSRVDPSTTHYSVVIVGGGQSGLSLSHCLQQRGIDHLVIEKRSLVHSWRSQRWDSFCLVTPNWQCNLPGWSYTGSDPHGFMVKDEINAWLAGFVAEVKPPALEGVTVDKVSKAGEAAHYTVDTSAGRFTAGQVVVASGGYHKPVVPRMAERLPASITQYHSAQYRNPAQLPEGAVLVVGCGQSGAQIAEDLRRFAAEGMELYGLMTGLDGDTLEFQPNLREHLDHADQIFNGINASIDKFIDANGIDAPPGGPYVPVWQPQEERTTLGLRASGITSVVWCIGFLPDFGWVDAPVFNGRGEPVHLRGVTGQAGLYFLGLPWLHTWGSGRFSGVARDAEFLAACIAERRGSAMAEAIAASPLALAA